VLGKKNSQIWSPTGKACFLGDEASEVDPKRINPVAKFLPGEIVVYSSEGGNFYACVEEKVTRGRKTTD
jgi:hypothetical protein